LLAVAQAAEEEGHAQDKQQIGQNRAKERGLDNADLVFDESDANDGVFRSATGYMTGGSDDGH
jgi:hypothetical protein